ncbi:hypothetical protein ACHAXA_001762 [Cyclostephanos tholiformis]|uniref:Uncharacterized protein n=1 Tax=Cyclostephanos tholiformis TaxID=382380 RepID=A0ABD3RYD2_9STRA
MRMNDSRDSLLDNPRQQDCSDGSKAADLSMLSQQSSASLKRSYISQNSSVGQRSLNDRRVNLSIGTQQQGGGRNVNQRVNEMKEDSYQLVLKIIEEAQGKKFSKVNSTRDKDAPIKSESRDSSMVMHSAPEKPEKNILPLTSGATPRLGKMALSGPAVRDIHFNERRFRAFAALDGHDASFNDARVPSSFNDISPSPNGLSDRMKKVSLARGELLGPNETQRSVVPPRALRLKIPHPTPSPAISSLDELPMTNGLGSGSEDWRKFLVNGDDQRNYNRQNNQKQPQPQSVSASQQCGDKNQDWISDNVTYRKLGEQRRASSERSIGSSDRRGGGQRKSKMSGKGRSIISGLSVSSSNLRGGVQRKSEMFGIDPKTKSINQRIKSRFVRKMAFTDHFGDSGFYSGCVNDKGRPDGKGSMKYDNGVFYEGTWMDGCQDKDAASQYERIRSGFTSWGGKGQGSSKSGSTLPWNFRKNDTHDDRAKTFVRGMEWIDFNGLSGRYTGAVNNDQIPHGTGIMKYDYGLIAQGHWINGVLKEGPLDRMISAAASMGPEISVGPGVGPGMSIGRAIGQMSSIGPGMSVGPGLGGSGFPMVPIIQPPPMNYGGMNPMVAAHNYYAAVAQRNNTLQHMNNNMYRGGGGQMPPLQMHNTIQPMSEMSQKSDKPPISEINIGK